MTAIATSTPNGCFITPLCAAIQNVTRRRGALKRLAYAARIPATTLTRYRDGVREPRASELMRLADAEPAIRDALVQRILQLDPEQRAAIMRALEARDGP